MPAQGTEFWSFMNLFARVKEIGHKCFSIDKAIGNSPDRWIRIIWGTENHGSNKGTSIVVTSSVWTKGMMFLREDILNVAGLLRCFFVITNQLFYGISLTLQAVPLLQQTGL